MSKRRLKAKFVELLSYLRFASFLGTLALILAPFIVIDYQVSEYTWTINKWAINNIFIPYKDWGLHLVWIGIVLLGVAKFGDYVKKNYIDGKKCETCKQNVESDYKWRLSQLLKRLSNELELNKPTQRISVYKHDQEAKRFIMLGRYSSNPKLKEDGRVSYPDDQGAIQAAWERKEDTIEIATDPNQNIEGYCDEIYQRWNIPPEVSKKFKMKSVYYSAHALENLQGERIAVVIWESTQKISTNKQTHEKLKQVMSEIRTYVVDNVRTEPSHSCVWKEGL